MPRKTGDRRVGAAPARTAGPRHSVFVGAQSLLNRIPRGAKIGLLLAVGLVLLTWFYLGVVLRIPYNAEHAALLVMARSMLEGNWLLQGWTVDHQPLFTTELPYYVVGISLLGFSWRVLYAVTAIHWALIALVVIYLGASAGDGHITPAKIVVATALTFYLPGVILANEWLSANHLVGFLYGLLSLLFLRSYSRRGRWRDLAIFAAFLTLAAAGDQFAIYVVAIPVAIVSAARLVADGRDRQSLLALIITAASVAAARLMNFLITHFEGALLPGPPARFVDLAGLGPNIYRLAASYFTLFSVDFWGQPLRSGEAAVGVLHLSGLVLFAVAINGIARRITRADMSTQVMVAVVAVNVLEFLLSGVSGASKYLAPSLFVGFVLVCEALFGSWLFLQRRTLVLLYFFILLVSLLPTLSYVPTKSPADQLGKLLIRKQLTHGYGPYWRADNTTVATAGQALVAPVFLDNNCLRRYPVFSDEDWYSGHANFLIIDAYDRSGLHPTREEAAEIFGEPAQEYELPNYGYLLVWDYDITPVVAAAPCVRR